MYSGPDHCRYNGPHHEQVAVVFTGEKFNGEPPNHRDIIIYPRDQPLRRISHISANCNPMVYPFMFPCGELGWHKEIHHVEMFKMAKRNKVTMLQFYTYRLAIRRQFSPIHYCRKLLQRYLVDAYVKTENQRLDYIRTQVDVLPSKNQALCCKLNLLIYCHSMYCNYVT